MFLKDDPEAFLIRCGPHETRKLIELDSQSELMIGEKSDTISEFQLNLILISGRQDSGICLLSIYVSREHLTVWKEENSWFIRDHGSFNGTFVHQNGFVDKIPAHEPFKIESGAVIGFGVNPLIWQTQDIYVNTPGEHFVIESEFTKLI